MNTRQRIMVVDDDRDMGHYLDRTLSPEGYDTVIVSDDSTLLRLEELEPDLVIIDSLESGVDDFRELDRIRRHSDVPIIVLTDRYEMESLRRAFSLGADDYIRKPLEKRTFLARIRAKLRRAR